MSRRCPPGEAAEFTPSSVRGSSRDFLPYSHPDMTLEVQTRQADNGATVVAPTGRLDVAGAPTLKEAISEALKNGSPKVVLDMEGISFVDSNGLGSVIAALKQIRSSKGDLRRPPAPRATCGSRPPTSR